jgi:lysophospholipase L1-like esterase
MMLQNINKTKKLLGISIILNLLFMCFGCVFIYRKGGIDYFVQKIKTCSGVTVSDNGSQKNRTTSYEMMPNDTDSIVFVGDSITDFFEWEEYFHNLKIKNRGVSGDMLQDIYNRLPEIMRLKPKKIFLMAGINNVKVLDPSVVKIYELIIRKIKSELPQTQIYIQSVLPVNNHLFCRTGGKKVNNKAVIELNKALFSLSKKYFCKYINLYLMFSDKGELNTKYTFDGIHLNGQGFLVWVNAIKQYVN